LLTDAAGRCRVSMQNYAIAIAIANYLETPKQMRCRLTVGY
jgi:putative NADH-flavin reductase